MMASFTIAPSLHLDASVTSGARIRRYRIRTLMIWAAVAAVGYIPVLVDAGQRLKAAGLGLWFPGAGFLYTGDWWITVVSLLAFALSLVAWWVLGGFIFPVLTWALAAILAAAVVGGPLWESAQFGVPLATLAALVTASAATTSTNRRREPKAAALADHLAAMPFVEPDLDLHAPTELTETDLAALRYILDRTLQPLDEFDGFTTIDQFREAAWRYQLVSFNYALAAAQVNHLPAFRGYLVEAQRNSIQKMRDRRVWRFWRVENFLGNLKLDADPIRSENIMYSGWWALALGAYERVTGDLSFSEPGALTLHDTRDRDYVYDYPAIVDALTRQFDADDLCFFPCEPNWVFSACNLFGMSGLLLFDREHGTRQGLDRLDHFNDVLEHDFTHADGRTIVLFSRRSGLSLTTSSPLPAMPLTWLINMTSPRLAQVYWAMIRRHLLERAGGDLNRIEPTPGEMIDGGNYRLNGTSFWSTMMAGAREMSDDELYELAVRKYADLGVIDDAGVLTMPGSVYSNSTAHVGRFGRKDTWHRLAHGDIPTATRTGPVLEQAPYPDVLVAFADNDGQSLRIVLRPGAGELDAPLTFAGLAPGCDYLLTGAGDSVRLASGEDGRATHSIRMNGRVELNLTPVFS